MSSLLKRHSTLLAFTLSIASSVAFVACGDDDPTPTTPEDDGGSGGKATGGKTGSGGASGGAASGGKGGGGAGGGPASGGKGGGTVDDGGPDAPISSNGDAASDASDD